MDIFDNQSHGYPKQKNGKAGGGAGRRQAVQRHLPRVRAVFLPGKEIRSGSLQGGEFGTDVCLLLGVPSEARDALPRRSRGRAPQASHLYNITSTRLTLNCPIFRF